MLSLFHFRLRYSALAAVSLALLALPPGRYHGLISMGAFQLWSPSFLYRQRQSVSYYLAEAVSQRNMRAMNSSTAPATRAHINGGLHGRRAIEIKR